MTTLQIIDSTDNQFIGTLFKLNEPLILNGSVMDFDTIQDLGDGLWRLSNSCYCIEAKEQDE